MNNCAVLLLLLLLSLLLLLLLLANNHWIYWRKISQDTMIYGVCINKGGGSFVSLFSISTPNKFFQRHHLETHHCMKHLVGAECWSLFKACLLWMQSENNSRVENSTIAIWRIDNKISHVCQSEPMRSTIHSMMELAVLILTCLVSPRRRLQQPWTHRVACMARKWSQLRHGNQQNSGWKMLKTIFQPTLMVAVPTCLQWPTK